MATIKFKDLIRGELQNKIRSVKDLVDYVGKSPTKDSHPNYSIFLGAGASVSSGIKTGGNLVNEWRKEIYEKECGDYFAGLKETDEQKKVEEAKQNAIDYLIKEHGVWYNPQNEYSSLFERKFDLPIQRRRFVEDIVDGHLPSIGYLYLITLINKNYFNTIFTTNFDDLINEAFYQFSDTRPLLCAHDSAVSSISVVAKRPKIIKLHGDYLFDDIKNTIKETESLEQNIKQKFIEFTKDNGLIVVGYSGQDRSILDVINYLLQQEDYLKNGLYWCFRSEDEISHEVRKILWKDKVYCVQIDGFDELFTEFCSVANVKPSLIDNLSENKRESCINKFVNDFNKSEIKNKWISEFIEEISTAKNNQDMSDLIRQFNENKTHNLSADTLKDLLLINSLIKKNEIDSALELVNSKINEEKDEELIESYYKLKIRIFKIQNKKDKAFKMIDKLIDNDEYNVKYYLWKLSFFKDINEKLLYLCDLNEKINYSVGVKNSIIKLFNKHNNSFEGDLSIDFDSCNQIINESLRIDPSIDNDAYSLKFDFLKIRKNKELKKEKNQKIRIDKEIKFNNEMDGLIDSVANLNKYNLEYLKIKKEYVLYKKDLTLIKNFIQEVDEIKSKLSKNRARDAINLVAHIYNIISEYTKDEIKGVANWSLISDFKIDDFFINYKDDDLKSTNIIFMLAFANYIISNKTDLSLLEEILDVILEISDSNSYIKSICDRFTVVKSNILNTKLEAFIKNNKGKLSISDYLYSMSALEKSKLNYISSLDFLKKHFKDVDLDGDDLISLIYAYLLALDYEGVLNFIDSQNSLIDTLSIEDRVVVSINRIAAKKLKNNTLDSTDKIELEGIISKHSDDKRILVCANSLLDLNSAASFHIKDLIDVDYTFYYQLMEWPAINKDLKSDARLYLDGLINNIPKTKVA